MKHDHLRLLILILLLSGCGMTHGQKVQVSNFATATSEAVEASVKQLVDIRSQVIEIRKERIILGDLPVTDKIDLDTTLKAEKIAQRVAVMKLLQDYANSLNALATNDQSEAISKAVLHLASSAEAASNQYKNDVDKLTITDAQKKAAAGIAATIGGWYIEYQKKEAVKDIVEKFSPLVTQLSGLIEKDMLLIGNSPCWTEFRSGASSGTKPLNDKKESGTLDIFCTQADTLREKSLELLRCPSTYTGKENPPIPPICGTVTVTTRERAMNDYLKINHGMDDVASFSKKAANLTKKLQAANEQLSKVITDDSFTAEDIKEHAAAIKELITMVEVLKNK